jgi:hypothetical protein
MYRFIPRLLVGSSVHRGAEGIVARRRNDRRARDEAEAQ